MACMDPIIFCRAPDENGVPSSARVATRQGPPGQNRPNGGLAAPQGGSDSSLMGWAMNPEPYFFVYVPSKATLRSPFASVDSHS